MRTGLLVVLRATTTAMPQSLRVNHWERWRSMLRPTPGSHRLSASNGKVSPLLKPTGVTPSRAKAKPAPAKEGGQGKARLGYKRERALVELPKKIAALQAEIATLQKALADPDLYRRDPKSFQSKTVRIGTAQSEIDAAESEWLELEMLKEELSG